MTTPISSFAEAEPYTVTRRGVESIGADGYPVPASTSTFSITATQQPAGGRAWQALSEGERQQDPREFWTESELRSADPLTGRPADLVTIDGATYKVKSVKRWLQIFPHYYAVALREGP